MNIPRRTKRVVLGFLFLTGVVVFSILASMRFSENRAMRMRYEQERAEMRAPEPNVHEVETGNFEQTRRFSAVLLPWMETDVPAEVSGRVVEVFVEPGDAVEDGAVLLRIDDTLAKIALERARAGHEEERRLLGEAERLYKTRAISDTQLHAQRSKVLVASAMLAEATENLDRHTVRAPFAGVVDSRTADVGEAVQPGTSVARIVDLDPLRVEFFASEEEIGAFPTGAEVTLELPSRPGGVFAPRIEHAARSADASTRLFRMQAVLENPELELPGGLQGVVTATVKRFDGLPGVPAAAVRFTGKKALVWKRGADGTEERAEIVVGPEIGGKYPVFSGLSAGDQVLIK